MMMLELAGALKWRLSVPIRTSMDFTNAGVTVASDGSLYFPIEDVLCKAVAAPDGDAALRGWSYNVTAAMSASLLADGGPAYIIDVVVGPGNIIYLTYFQGMETTGVIALRCVCQCQCLRVTICQ